MKTITVKADKEFDAILSQLATRLHTSRSDVIRSAVKKYQDYLDREAMRQKIRAASLKTREQAIQAAEEFATANNDGIENGF